jgi:uncharacterized Zn finger protein
MTEEDVLARTTNKFFSLAEGLVDEGAVSVLVLRGDYLHGKVDGGDIRPFKVDIKFGPHGIEWTHCSSGVNPAGDSQYVAAVLLTYVRFPEDVEVRPPIDEQLSRLDARALRDLWLERVEQDVQAIDWLEAHIPLVLDEAALEMANSPMVAAEPEATSKSLPRLDRASVQWQVNASIHSLDHLAKKDAKPRVNEVIEELRMTLKAIMEISRESDVYDALDLLEAMIEVWCNEFSALADISNESLSFWDDLDEALAELLLLARLSEDEFDQWYGILTDWQDDSSDLYPEALSLSAIALEEGWDDEELQLILQSKVVPLHEQELNEEAFAEDDDFALKERLQLIRLRVLRQQKRTEEFANFARHYGLILPWMKLLIEVDQYMDAMPRVLELLRKPDEAWTLTQLLYSKDDTHSALQVLDRMLVLDGTYYEEWLGWGRNLAIEVGDFALAKRIGFEHFRMFPTLDNYKALESLFGGSWVETKPEIEEILSQERDRVRDKVEILLYEDRLDEAISMIEGLEDDDVLGEAIEAVMVHRAAWALQICKQQAEPLIEAGLGFGYPQAIKWLERGIQAAKHNNELRAYHSYIQRLLSTHSRKRKLTPGLQDVLKKTNELRKKSRGKRGPKSGRGKKRTVAVDAKTYNDFLSGLSEQAVQFLDTLKVRGNLLMSEAKDVLELDSQRAVGGIVGSIKRRANRIGIQPPYMTGTTDSGERFWQWIGPT